MLKLFFNGAVLTSLMISCTFDRLEPPVDCTLSELEISLISKSKANCNTSNGNAVVIAINGSGDYVYSLSGFADQTTGVFSDLAAGNFSFLVTDSNGCTDQINVTIENIDGVLISSISTQDAGCNTSNGQINITASDGDLPYQYKVGSSAFQSSNQFPNLSSGSFDVTVKDAGGCEFSQNVTVNSGVSFSTTISPIISSNCAISGCHNGSQFPDFRNFSNIKNNASNIKSRTSSGNMPLDGSLTQQQKANIACWVDDGAPNN